MEGGSAECFRHTDVQKNERIFENTNTQKYTCLPVTVIRIYGK